MDTSTITIIGLGLLLVGSAKFVGIFTHKFLRFLRIPANFTLFISTVVCATAVVGGLLAVFYGVSNPTGKTLILEYGLVAWAAFTVYLALQVNARVSSSNGSNGYKPEFNSQIYENQQTFLPDIAREWDTSTNGGDTWHHHQD